MSQHPTYSSEWFHHFRSRFDCWGHGNSHVAEADLLEILADVRERVAVERNTPVKVTVTANQGDTMSKAPGETITFTATTDNAEGVALPTDANGQPFTYTWTATAGTIVPGADTTTTTITISDAPLGDVTATATNNAGFIGSATETVADQTPASVTVTAS